MQQKSLGPGRGFLLLGVIDQVALAAGAQLVSGSGVYRSDSSEVISELGTIQPEPRTQGSPSIQRLVKVIVPKVNEACINYPPNP